MRMGSPEQMTSSTIRKEKHYAAINDFERLLAQHDMILPPKRVGRLGRVEARTAVYRLYREACGRNLMVRRWWHVSSSCFSTRFMILGWRTEWCWYREI